jgi:beta-galactosidase/beta-glucuronidase
MLKDLWTPEGEILHNNPEMQPWDIYPRPQMKRDNWLNLNGQWDFTAKKEDWLPKEYDLTIRVPFCPEAPLSGIHGHFPEGTNLFYRRKLTLPEGFNRGRVILHIGAADQVADVYVNGQEVCHHEGGYESFSCDITDALQEESELVIRCRDDLNNQSYPYGKQVLPEKRGGMWYTPVSGIWQTVWVESVPQSYVQKLNIENRGYSVTISIEPKLGGAVHVKDLGSVPLVDGKVTITPENPNLWSPENPYLYDFTLEAGEDRIESYFAIRSLEVKKVGKYPRLCLNGKPYFFHGLLDQGYWPEGLLTAPAPESFERDILAMKKLGFNTLRKHIKVEPEEFYYQCDKLGMIVWQDMVNNSDYNFLRDTALPTVGIQTLNDKNMHKDHLHRICFLMNAAKTVMQLKNHPSICYWTIFNEAWGQFDSDEVFETFKGWDDTRFIDSTSGWFRRKNSDVDSRHVYFRKVKLTGDGVKPLVLSEFGGKTYKAEGHIFNPEKSYGYGGCDSLAALNDAVAALYYDEVVPCVHQGLCAAIYTQVSDVEDEINGLLTYDRRVEKLNEQTMLGVAEALARAIEE